MLLGMLSLGLLLTIFGLFRVGAPRRVYFELILKPEVPTEAGSSAYLGRGLVRIVTGVWEVELLAAGDLAGYIGPARVMRWMCIVLSTLLTLLLLL